jgi:competence ComEA-like helix-hairpin-helix protein
MQLYRRVAMPERTINLNTATAEDLTQLPGIGPVLAKRIVTYRDTTGFFQEPSQITAVSGIGERSYRAVADRLAVAVPDELSWPVVEAPQEEIDEMEKTSAEPAAEEKIPPEAAAPSEEEIAPGAAIEPEVKASPAGEPMLEEKLAFGEEAAEESAAETPPPTDHVPVETTEEAPPEVGDVSEEMIEEGPPEAQEVSAEEEATTEVEEEPAEVRPDAEAGALEAGLPGADVGERREPAPSRSWWRRLSWLWTALLGALLGMAFALAVFSGVNGSLDVGHSRAVVDVRGRASSLATDINSLQGDVEGLRKRLDALEELAVRMDRAEAAVGDLQEETVGLGERADALEERVTAVVEELEAVSEQVETLRDQAEQTRSFFQALQALLNDFFGEVEGNQ